MKALLALVLLLSAGAAVAETRKRDNLNAPSSRQMLTQLAKCLFKKNPERARDLILSPDLEQGLQKLAWRHEQCLAGDGALRMTPVLLRGALAEEAFAIDFGRGTLAKISESEWNSVKQSDDPIREMVLCAVRQDPRLVEEYILSPVASREEAIAQQEVEALLPACTSKKMRLNVPGMRADFSVWIYRAAEYYLKYKPSLAGKPNA